jgi:hypothetical protein
MGVVLREGEVLGGGSGVRGEGLGTALAVRLGMYPLGSRHSPPRNSTRQRLDSRTIKACTRFKKCLKWAIL